MLAAGARRRLESLLEGARGRGMLGPGPVGPHIDHAIGLACLIGGLRGRFLDLGSGAGVPGLVFALMWPDAEGVLLESHARRCAQLQFAVGELELTRCSVVRGRAEDVGRDPEHREGYDLVVARAFGSPGVTAECGAPLLVVGGRLVVSDPPDAEPGRWPRDGLSRLGLGAAELRRQGDVGVAVTEKTQRMSDEWPRRTGVPAKRPLW